jgi:hypothetical protein
MKDKKLTKPVLLVGGIVIGMILILFLSTSVIPQVLITLTKASNSGEVVASNSYVIGEKILAKADGVDKCVVNVFLLDKDGKGSMGKSVTLIGMDNIKAVGSGLSDSMGKITFEMTSLVEKTYSIKATSEGSPLPQTIIVTFKN